MVPSFSIRASRFCTVPRATRRDLAKEATDNRALSRNSESSWRSVESMGAPSAANVDILRGNLNFVQIFSIDCLFDQYPTLIDQLPGYSLAYPSPETSSLAQGGNHGELHWNCAPAGIGVAPRARAVHRRTGRRDRGRLSALERVR